MSKDDRNWLVRAQDKLERLRSEQRPKQPNNDVVESVRNALSLLYLANMKPSRIVATAEGGISLWFIRDGYKALLEISNDSPRSAAFAEISNGNYPIISEISLTCGELIPALTKVRRNA